jgi:hypothetical protein
MILLMMEEIKSVAVLTPGVPRVPKIVSVQSPYFSSVSLYYFKILVPHSILARARYLQLINIENCFISTEPYL